MVSVHKLAIERSAGFRVQTAADHSICARTMDAIAVVGVGIGFGDDNSALDQRIPAEHAIARALINSTRFVCGVQPTCQTCSSFAKNSSVVAHWWRTRCASVRVAASGVSASAAAQTANFALICGQSTSKAERGPAHVDYLTY
jgi:hypothetical protein